MTNRNSCLEVTKLQYLMDDFSKSVIEIVFKSTCSQGPSYNFQKFITGKLELSPERVQDFVGFMLCLLAILHTQKSDQLVLLEAF